MAKRAILFASAGPFSLSYRDGLVVILAKLGMYKIPSHSRDIRPTRTILENVDDTRNRDKPVSGKCQLHFDILPN